LKIHQTNPNLGKETLNNKQQTTNHNKQYILVTQSQQQKKTHNNDTNDNKKSTTIRANPKMWNFMHGATSPRSQLELTLGSTIKGIKHMMVS